MWVGGDQPVVALLPSQNHLPRSTARSVQPYRVGGRVRGLDRPAHEML